MMLVEETFVPERALPVDALKRHLRLGRGFAEDDVQDEVLASFLRAALAAVEARTGKALIRRAFLLSVREWSAGDVQNLPIAPVASILGLDVVDRFGAVTAIDPVTVQLEADAHFPRLKSVTSALSGIPSGGTAEVRFEAGYSTEFSGLPADLQQAVLLLAAHYYEYRDETALGQGCMPFGVSSLLARFRPMRLGARE
ncbi:MAG: head-tail connector protein [Pseudomonadota bacterium]|nr:head-tail connector protein [Pseudomonadota bacterium]